MLDLYRFELKKILAQKLLWILAAAILLGLAVFGVATEVRPTNSGLPMGEVIALQREGSQELAGQTVDQAFLDRLLPLFTDPEANTEAQLKYNDFFNWLTLILGTAHRQEILQTDEARLYEALWHQLAPDPQAAGLTQEEIAHWTEQAQARLAQPLVYQGYHEGWQTAAHGMKVMVFLEILFLAVVLAPLFPQEHLRRTDQLILSCRFGRGKAYAAKLLAGVTVGVGFTALLLLAYLGMLGLVYGLEGANVPALFTHLFPADLTIGEMVGILFLAALAAAVLVSVAVMLLAELAHPERHRRHGGGAGHPPADHHDLRRAGEPAGTGHPVVRHPQQLPLPARGLPVSPAHCGGGRLPHLAGDPGGVAAPGPGDRPGRAVGLQPLPGGRPVSRLLSQENTKREGTVSLRALSYHTPGVFRRRQW